MHIVWMKNGLRFYFMKNTTIDGKKYWTLRIGRLIISTIKL